jgi:hypothetical protein
MQMIVHGNRNVMLLSKIHFIICDVHFSLTIFALKVRARKRSRVRNPVGGHECSLLFSACLVVETTTILANVFLNYSMQMPEWCIDCVLCRKCFK